MDKRKLSIAELLAKKERRSVQTTEVYVPGLEGCLELVRQPLGMYIDLNGRIAEAPDGEAFLRAAADEIYEFCPILHSQEMQEGYDCKVPTDIVHKLLGDSLGDYMAICTAINGLYDMDGASPRDEAKN